MTTAAFDPFAGPAPRVWSIPAGAPFVDALARGILQAVGTDPLRLSEATVLLPTRRACRSLREAFLRLSDGRPMLLPRMSPLGDIDPDALDIGLGDLPGVAQALDLPPVISGVRRQLLLARLIRARAEAEGEALAPDQAAWLAGDLARLIDEVDTEGLSFDNLDRLVPADLAEHWQKTVDFLDIVTKAWPAVLEAEGATDPARRRNAVLDAQAALWRERPPAGPVVAAGSTGSIPATRRLLAVVAGLPRGAVVLPGLDTAMDPEAWAAVDEGHPQYGMREVLRALGRDRADVPEWPVPPAARPAQPPDRRRLIAEALRPAATTDAWRDLCGRALPSDALRGLTRIEAPTPDAEAGAIALLMRGVLEEPGRTAALVTPDRGLARRVAAALDRWGIAVDDSGGRPLADTAVGSYLRLVADAVRRNLAPVALLALAKHPLAGGGLAPGAFREQIRRLERAVLRGPRPAPGVEGLRAALAAAGEDPHRKALKPHELLPLVDRLETLLAPALDLAAADAADAAPVRDLLRAHVAAAEALAGTDATPGPERLWRKDDGEAAAALIAELAEAAGDLPPIAPADWPGLFEAMLAPRVVRPRWGDHPRLFILGPLEARLQSFDLVVLGGLNEGSWPREPAPDPWMSRPMRAAFGLPGPDRRIGLSAHDFAQAFAAPEVAITRAAKAEGAPTVPSRWLLRMDAVLQAAGLSTEVQPALPPDPVPVAWAALLDRPEAVRPIASPEPRPPAEARPKRLSVTQIGRLFSDPYEIYARKVLRLEALDPLEADPGAADKGEIIHDALAAFLGEIGPGPLPPDALARLIDCGRQRFEAIAAWPGLHAFWWTRFQRIAAWVIDEETRRRADGTVPARLEVPGSMAVGPAFTLTARADRIDRDADGRLHLIDYKTGTVPTQKQIVAGYAPQLPLEALIAIAGGFEDLPAGPVGGMEYWRLTGGHPPGECRPVKETRNPPLTQAELIERARAGLTRLIATFGDPATPYRSRPNPFNLPSYSDFGHLARIDEWIGGDGGGEA